MEEQLVSNTDQNRFYNFWSRAFAYGVDCMILVPFGCFGWFLQANGSMHTAKLLVEILLISVIPIYYIYCTSRFGQTVGKRLFNLKVLDAEERDFPEYQSSVLRHITYIVNVLFIVMTNIIPKYSHSGEALPDYGNIVNFGLIFVLFFLVDIIFLIISPKRQALHDFIGKTVVVKENDAPEISGAKRTAIVIAAVITSIAIPTYYVKNAIATKLTKIGSGYVSLFNNSIEKAKVLKINPKKFPKKLPKYSRSVFDVCLMNTQIYLKDVKKPKKICACTASQLSKEEHLAIQRVLQPKIEKNANKTQIMSAIDFANNKTIKDMFPKGLAAFKACGCALKQASVCNILSKQQN